MVWKLKWHFKGLVLSLEWGRGGSGGSESPAQPGPNLLGAMLLANPLTDALTWRMAWPSHALNAHGQRGGCEYKQLVCCFRNPHISEKQHMAEAL